MPVSTNEILGTAIGLIVVAVVLPTALGLIANASLSGVDPTVVTIFQVLLPILAIIGVAAYFFPKIK